jgi:hypothetical protein
MDARSIGRSEPNHRGEWAYRYGFSIWNVVSYDAESKGVSLAGGKADCAGEKHSQ